MILHAGMLHLKRREKAWNPSHLTLRTGIDLNDSP